MPANDYLNASSFKVSIDGISDAEKFETVSGIGCLVEDIPFQAEEDKGIENRPGRYNAYDISLSRRFKGDKGLYNWFDEVKKGKRTPKSGSIILMDDEDKEVLRFNFFGSWPKSWLAPSLSKDASGNDVLLETVVLSVKDVEMA